jgi:DNA invertase Pin-like site-specific DNA recombinase
MVQQNEYTAGIYCRYSKDDGKVEDSSSISTQKEMLAKYVREHGWKLADTYVDDGYTGLNTNRPSFQRLISDCKNGKINLVVTKDLSRLGRNHLYVGLYTEEILPKYSVRYIVIADNFDTQDPNRNSEFAAIFNIFNEMHVKSTSLKIRAAQKTKVERGERLAVRAPYGYVRMTDSTNIVPNPETAPVVKKIYQMCIDGAGPRAIARRLTEEKILTPSVYEFYRSGKKFRCLDLENPYNWDISTVRGILDLKDYTGDSECMKFTNISYKNKKQIKRPPEEHVILENTHEGIIDRDVWEQVQRIRKNRRRNTKFGDSGLFSGLVYCADCKSKMTFFRSHSYNAKNFAYICSHYRSGKFADKCSRHSIKVTDLTAVVLAEIRRVQ